MRTTILLSAVLLPLVSGTAPFARGQAPAPPTSLAPPTGVLVPSGPPSAAPSPLPADRAAPVAVVAQTPGDAGAASESAAPVAAAPADAGQVWQEYDLRAYVQKNGAGSEREVVDWILRETGTDPWFTDPPASLGVSANRLRVLHTPSVQARVRDIVDRLTGSATDGYYLTLRLATIGNPNWRTQALRVMRPVPAQSAGVEAWLLSKENAAILAAELARRVDYREQSTPGQQVPNGRTEHLANHRPRQYSRTIMFREGAFGGAEPERAQIDEGFSLRISPLMSVDHRAVDVVLRCEIDQVEKLLPVQIDVPSVSGAAQRMQIEVPQLVSWRLHERFRWPADQVLLLSCGVVAEPAPETRRGPLGLGGPLALGGENRTLPLGIPLPFSGQSPRADALLFLECQAPGASGARGPAPAAAALAPNRGRY